MAEALHKPTQLLCDVPTQTCIDAQELCEADFYVNSTECTFPLKKHSYFPRFYFISRYQINDFVKLGLSVRTRGIAVLDALMLSAHTYA